LNKQKFERKNLANHTNDDGEIMDSGSLRIQTERHGLTDSWFTMFHIKSFSKKKLFKNYEIYFRTYFL